MSIAPQDKHLVEWSDTLEWEVPSDSQRTRFYKVRRHNDVTVTIDTPDRWTCSCEDWTFRSKKRLGYKCKHIERVIKDRITVYRIAFEGEDYTP